MAESLSEVVARWLRGERDAVSAIVARLRAHRPAETIALAAELRDRGSSGRFGGRWTSLDAGDARVVLARDRDVELAGLLSLHRSGYVRSAALAALEGTRDPFALRFLVLRLDDIVEATRAQALDAVRARLDRAHAAELARLLPLIDQVARRTRGGASSLQRELAAFLSAPASGWATLVGATRDRDATVRRSALRLAVRHASRSADRIALLVQGLADHDASIARWSAIEAMSSRVDPEVQDALLPALEASRDPIIRRRAVLARARRPDASVHLARAMTDPRSRVRITARDKLPGHARDACLAALASPARRLGGLGGLAEVGRAGDAPRALPFVDDPDPAVRAEAIRCLGMLAPAAYVEVLERAAGSTSARVRREAARALTRLRTSGA